jgi:hypothetical protein
MIRMTPIVSNILGGLRIDVPVGQETLAREILGQDGTEVVVRRPQLKSQTCNVCGSADLVHGSRNRAARLITAILALFFGAAGVPRGLNKELRCRECGSFIPLEEGPRKAELGSNGDGAG